MPKTICEACEYENQYLVYSGKEHTCGLKSLIDTTPKSYNRDASISPSYKGHCTVGRTTNPSCDMPKEKTDWVERFGKKFVNHGEFIYNIGSYPATCGEVKSFIETLLKEKLAEQKQEIIEEIERTIQEERFSGAPFALNKVIKNIKSL